MTATTSSEALVIRGYRLGEQLGRDERFVLYRARPDQGSASVLLKLPVNAAPCSADIGLLGREAELLDGLPIDAVTRPQRFVNEPGVCALVLADGGGVMLDALLREGKPPLGWVLDYATQLVGVLAELHRCGVVHRGLRPQAVLVEGPERRVRLADFTDAARGSAEACVPLAPRLYRSRLPYAAPEHTGRAAGGCDHRSDFYSLGILLYELLCAHVPFTASDPLELIHAHLARLPPAPVEVNSALPLPVSQIVMKLLAKAPEERYQSAASLLADLQRCRSEWSRYGRVLPFAIAQRDVSEQFALPGRLYGRAGELALLHAAFERAREGAAGLLLVSGYAGVGKTALIRELAGPVACAAGHFVSGKFDQLASDAPYRALVQALRQLVRQLLAEPATQLARKCDRLRDALGDNAGAIASLIPELSLLLGEAPALPWLPPAQAHNRLRLAFQNLIAALATADHPLVIFLDDLQWVDAATVQLVEAMFASTAQHHFLLVGAYRDNEVEPGHALLASVAALREAGVPVDRLTLAPLGPDALVELTADTLHVPAPAAEPLAALLLIKTAGNPFFTTQFLLTLHHDGLIEFDRDEAAWVCRLEQVAAAATSDNVADLMSRKIERLAPVTQAVVTLAACIGHRFDARTLAVVSEQTLEVTASDLAEAALEGLIAAEAEHVYVFVHDRVQQAAYARIAPAERPQRHLQIGRLLLARAVGEPTGDTLFDIVSHLNIGADLIETAAERLALARLNLSAGNQAKSASAFQSALSHFSAGATLLDPPHWSSHYELAFALRIEAAACEYLCGNFDAAERDFATLLQRAASTLDKARVHSLRMVQFESLARYSDALASAREGLALFGVALPHEAAHKQAALEREIAATEAHMGPRSIANLIELPVMRDPDMRMVMSILTDIWSSAYIQGDATLARLISAMLVRLSLEHGQCEESAYGYVTHAITLGPVRQDYAAAYAFGTLALQVNQRFDDKRRRAKIYQQFHAHVNLWCQPMQSCIAYAKEACRSGLASGDFSYAAYAASTESWPALVACQDLAACVRSLQPNLALVVRLENTPFADALRLVMAWARALQGETSAALSLSHGHDGGFDEGVYVQAYGTNPFFTLFHAIARLHLSCLLDEQAQALAAALSVRESAHQLTGMIWSVLFDVWGSLALAANIERAADAAQRAAWCAEIGAAQGRLAVLAHHCAPNYLCHSLLLQAELDRIAGHDDAALASYESALACADEFESVQQQALANELLAKYWLSRGHRGMAAPFLRTALAHYTAWGAGAKRRQLLERHADLLTAPMPEANAPNAAIAASAAEPAESLDLATIVKAAHAIAESVDLDRLLEHLLAIAIENAAATRGVLIEESDGELLVVAEGTGPRDPVSLLRHAGVPAAAPRCSRAVLDYVLRTHASLVIADAGQDERFAADPHVLAARPKSVLCLPIVHQGRVSAVVYLENNLARDAFSARRIEVIQVLMAQGSISLANARLSRRMRLEVGERQRAEETLRVIEAGTASVTGADFFGALVRNLARALDVRYVWVAECFVAAGSGCTAARSRAFWKDGDFGADFEYEVPGTPCQAVLEGQTCHHASNVHALFPNDRWLASLGAQSYLGMPLLGSDGAVIGHMAIMDRRPLPDAAMATSVLRLSAGRAGSELERLKAAEGQQRALAQVEELKNRLQEENVYLRRELIANVSHDLRSPLASLRGYLDTLLLKESTLAPAQRRAYLEIAVRQAEQLQLLISELFELARLDFQGYRIEPEPVQLGELARDVVQKLQLAAQAAQVALHAEIHPDLGFVRADIGLIERTLTNLLENALAHTPAGGRIVLSVRAEGARAMLRVSDTGSGIGAADLPHIFERFYRADKARSRNAHGSGLGLAIVKRIVELHQSAIHVDSVVGRGTSFWFELPLA